MSNQPLWQSNPEMWQAAPVPFNKPKRRVWLWIALTGGFLWTCLLGGIALVVLGGLLGKPSADLTNSSVTPSYSQAPFDAPNFPTDSGSAPGSIYDDFGNGAGSEFGLGNTDSLAESIREHSNENSWWAEEWSRALGDNYPEPSHADPDGNPGWIDHSGAFHDYNSGMSDYESATLGGAYSGE